MEPKQFYQEIYRKGRKLSFEAIGQGQAAYWQSALRSKLYQLTGVDRLVGQPMQVSTLAEKRPFEPYPSLTIQKVGIHSGPGLGMPAYVLQPKDEGPMPAMVALHGHGRGKDEIVGLYPESYQKNFAARLALRGYVVIVPDLFGFGERRNLEDLETRPNSCTWLSLHGLMHGITVPGIRIFEAMRCVDYLASLPDVDPKRIGCMGISGGGLVSLFLGAMDTRLAATVVSGYMNTFQASVMSIEHCLDNYVPDLLTYAEMYDIAGLVAPRPLFVQNGVHDPIFPVGAAHDALAEVSRIYRHFEASQRLGVEIFEGDHQISNAVVYDWLDQWL